MRVASFRGSGPERRVCGVLPASDLALHLESRGIGSLPGVIAVRSDLLSRQPLEQLCDSSVDGAAALACTGKPWGAMCVFTDPHGLITGFERNPAPELARTNVVLAGACWFREEPEPGQSLEDTVETALNSGAVLKGVLLRGRAFIVCSGEEQLRASHALLSGLVVPGVHGCVAVNRAFIQGRLDPSVRVSGTLWTAPGSVVEPGCELENCVILEDTLIGRGCKLKNTLVEAGTRVPPGTVMEDKYPSFLGETTC